MAYRDGYKSSPKPSSGGKNAGTVESHSETTMGLCATGGKKYSTDNVAELKSNAEGLAKVLNK